MSDPVLDALRRGDPAAAVAAAETALRERPDDADAHHLHGVALLLAGRPEQAEPSLERAIALAPDRPLYHTSRSALALAGGDLEAAGRGLDQAATLDPNRLHVYLAQAQLAMARNDLAEAEQRITLALRVDGNHPRVLLALGNLRLAKGEDEAALKAFLEAAKRAPDDASVQSSTGVAFLRRNLPDFAEQSLRNALATEPGHPPALRALLGLLLRQGRAEDALALAREAVEARPGHAADGWALVGDLEAMLGRQAAAEQAFARALELAPDHRTALTALITLLIQAGEHGRARELLEGRLLLDPGHELGWVLRQAVEGDPGAALAVARRWQSARPESAGAAEALALLAEAQGDLARAEQQADAALARDPARLAAQLVKARAELRHTPRAALERLRPLCRQPRDARWLQALLGWAGHAADAAGEPAEAVQYWLANHGLVEGPATELPAYGALDDTLRQRAQAARAAAGTGSEQPLFLVGAPGSGVERAGLLLRGQDALPLLDERFVSPMRGDGFLRPDYPRWLSGDLAAAMDVQAAWRNGVSARQLDPAQPLIDWLPHFDARQLAVLPAALPAARFLLALRDPRDMLLNWLAWGTIHRFAVRDPVEAAGWLNQALLHLGEIASVFPLVELRGEALETDREAAAVELARALDWPAPPDTTRLAQSLHTAEGWPSALPAGSWRRYRDVLDAAFAALGPAVARFGYPAA